MLVRPIVIAVLALLALAPLLAPAGAADEPPKVPCSDPRGCPDLIVDERAFRPFRQSRTFDEHDCAVKEGMVEPGTRELLRFDFSTPNLGPGDLIVGPPRLHPEWFEFGTCHGHEHFKEYADYRLWTIEGFARWDAAREANPNLTAEDVLALHPELEREFVAGHKQGFCVIDVRSYSFPAVPKYLLCEFQGISVGYADVYDAQLDGQWVDVTDVPAGEYVLETEVNAERFYDEADFTNNRAWTRVTV